MEAPATLKMSPAMVAAEGRARDFLAKGQWRKARDEIKPLAKIDRPRYLPLLIQANVGLSREMIAKGQIPEAQQVLAYLATIASPDQLRAVELELAGRSQSTPDALGKVLSALADHVSPLPQADQIRLADQAVLLFQTVPAAQQALAGSAAPFGPLFTVSKRTSAASGPTGETLFTRVSTSVPRG